MKHYGVWSDKYGWSYTNGGVFFTEHVAIASAQCHTNNLILHSLPAENLYRVRCVEDWYTEKNVSDTLEALDV